MNKSKGNLVILTCIFILIMILQSMIFMSFDDYGFGAISYAVGNQHNLSGGVNYSLIDILAFLKDTYMMWSGRILGPFLLIECLKNGQWVIQIVQAGVIFFTLFFTVKVFCKEENFTKKFVLSIAIFFGIPIEITKLSLYWYSASVTYFWPFLFFILGLYIIKNNEDNSFINKILLVVLGLISGWSQEQVGMAFCAFMFVVVCWDYIFNNKTFENKKVVFFISNIIGYIILMIAPGNFARMANDSSNRIINSSILTTLIKGSKALISNLRYFNTSIVYIIIILSLIMLLYNNISKNENLEKIKKISIIIIALTEIIVLLFPFINIKIIRYCILIIHFLFMLIGLAIYIVLYKDKVLAALTFSGIASLIPILVSPYFVERMLLPIYYIGLIILIVMLEEIKNSINLLKYSKINNIIICILLLTGIYGYATTLVGYFENSIPKNINNNILSQSSGRIKNGEKIEKIYLYKNINERYTGTQPYEVDYTGSIKEFYKIPSDVVILFREFPEENSLKALKTIEKYGIIGIEDSTSINKIDAINEKEDLSKLLSGFYSLEIYPNESFYWIQKNTEAILKNNSIPKNGIKIKLKVNKNNLLKSNLSIDKVTMKIMINDIEVEEVEILDGEQEIIIKPEKLKNSYDNMYKINLQSNCDFCLKDIGESDDARRLFAQLYYIGSN